MFEGFVITKKGDAISEDMANQCISSGFENNFSITKFYGVYQDIDQLIESEKLFFNPQGLKKIKTQGIKGCFLSHFLLWKRCLEKNTPVAIFEYDALVLNPLSLSILDSFEDCLNLDFARHLYLEEPEKYKSLLKKTDNIKIHKLQENLATQDKTSYKYMNKNHIKGAFGYILKPSGAKKLIDGIIADGIVPADVALNLRYISLSYTSTSVVCLNPVMLENLKILSHTKNYKK